MEAIISACRKHWLLCVGSAAIVAIGSLALGFVMKPVYRVEAVLVPVRESRSAGALANVMGQLGGLAALAGIGSQSGQQRYESIAVLRSPSFVGRFIVDKNLLPVLFPDKHRSGVLGRRTPTLNDAIEAFLMRVLTVKDDPKTGLVTLRIEWTDPKVAASWCRDFVQKANEVIRSRDIREAKQGIEYLKKELDQTTQVGIQQAINNVLEEHLKVVTLASVRQEYAFKVIEPGIIPDADRPERPKKLLMAIAGLVLGAIVGLLIACIREGVFALGRQHADGPVRSG